MNVIRFAVKHAVASGVVVGGIVALAGASYFALLAWAVLLGGPLGGPLAFPFMLLFALVASVGLVGFVLLPATVITEWICLKKGLRLGTQIPIAAAMVGVCLLLAVVVFVLRGVPAGSAMAVAGVMFALFLVPLGAYWWSMQSADWLLQKITSWWTAG